jgi:hypothetical protein
VVVEEAVVEERALRPVGCSKSRTDKGDKTETRRKRKNYSIHIMKAGTLGGLAAGSQYAWRYRKVEWWW